MDWVDPLVRGLVALGVTGLIFLAARLRFRGKKEGSGDIGLD